MAGLSKPRSILLLLLLMVSFILFRFIETDYANFSTSIARRISIITYGGLRLPEAESDFVEADVDFMSLPEMPAEEGEEANKSSTGFGGIPFNITKETPFRTLEELKELVGFQCPSMKHCSLWPRSFLKGGLWSSYRLDVERRGSGESVHEISDALQFEQGLGLDEQQSPEEVRRRIFHPYNCWWYQFSGDETWLNPLSSHHVGLFLDSSLKTSSLFARVVMLEPRFKYLRTGLTTSAEEMESLIMRIQKVVGQAQSVQLSVFTNFRGVDANSLYMALKLLKTRLPFAARVYWVNQHFVSKDTVDNILGLNHKMSLLFNNDKVDGLRYVDVFAPTLFAPETADMQQMMPAYLKIVALNYIFQSRILQLAALPKAQHICRTNHSCSSCFMVHSRLPSSRLTFRLLSNYFTRYGTPTIITINPENRVWSGTWQDFANENGDTPLKVRLNYETVRSRTYRRISIRKYLQLVDILKPQRTPAASVPSIRSTLPLYAGNNKLSPEAMRNFNFRYPPWFSPKSLQSPSMWLGPKDSVSSLHVDHGNKGNLAYQVLGSKLWHLFSPAAKQYAFLIKIGPVYWSRISDPREYHAKPKLRGFDRFKFALANSMKVHLREGEMLFNPDQWGHAVYNTNASLMLNFWLRKARLRQPSNRNDLG